MKKIGFSLCFLVLLAIFSPKSAYAALNWNETQPAGDTNNSWAASAISSTGQKMIVGQQDGGLYLSSNAGGSWTPVLTDFPFDVWYTASMSSDGQVILVGTYGQRLYLSTDGGTNWSETRPIGDSDTNWLTSSMSADGSVILVNNELGRLYRSLDSGNSWAEVRPAGDVNGSWYTDISSDGQTMLAGMDNGSGGRLYKSTNAGNTWSETRPDGSVDRGWRTVSISGDGQVMLAGEYSQLLYLSTNGGSTWAETQPVGNQTQEWTHSTISADGGTFFLSSTQRLHTSTNQGTAWSELQPIGNQNGTWDLLNMSGNGQVLLAGNYSGRLYIGTYPPLTTPSSSVNSPSCNNTSPSGIPDLFQIDPAGTYINLYFTKPSGDISGYTINYGLDNNANQYSDTFDYGKPDWIIGRTISYLSPNTTYYFKVQARNGCSSGGWSSVKQVKTKGSLANVTRWFANLVPFKGKPQPNSTGLTNSQGSPNSCSYIVQSGDSLWNIAAEQLGSGAKYTQILQLNPGLTRESTLKVNQKLILCI